MKLSRRRALHTAHLPEEAAAVLDLRPWRGRWHHLAPAAGAWWHRVASGVAPDRAIEELAASASTTDPEHARATLRGIATQLDQLRLHASRAHPAPPHPSSRLRLEDITEPSRSDRATAALALTLAVLALRCLPFRTVLAIARTTGRPTVPEATPERADTLLLAVRQSARRWPTRCACLEHSLALAIAARLRSTRVTWVIGARHRPAAAHAWTETGGEIIGQEPDDHPWPYHPALRT